MDTLRLLIVDDSLTIRAMVEQLLGTAPGIEIVGMFGSADEAWSFMKGHKLDVLTLDIAMPGLDGLHFLTEVMAERPVPVVMLSGRTAKGNAECDEALHRGAVACFDKACIVSEGHRLIRTIRQAARRKVKKVDATDFDAPWQI